MKSGVVPSLLVGVSFFVLLTQCHGLYPGLHRSKRSTGVITRKLRIVTIEHKPYTRITQSPNGLRYEGFIPDLIFLLSRKLHFTYEFYPSPDGNFGTLQPDGTWSGMIGELMLDRQHDQNGNASSSAVHSNRPRADMIAAPLVITSKRQRAVDFVHPFHNLGFTVLVQRYHAVDNGSDVPAFDFSIVRPFAPSVWALILISAIAVALLLFALNQFNPYEWRGRYNAGQASVHQSDSFSLSGALWFVFSTLQWQGFERAPRSIASKLLTCFWFVFVTLTLVTYIGSLVNHLWWSSAVLRHLPTAHLIRDLDDLVSGAGGHFKYGTYRHGQSYKYITEVLAKQRQEFQIMKKYWESEEGEQQLVDSLEEGLKKMRSGRYAFITDTMSARYEKNQQPCDLTTVGDQFGVRSYGLAVPKDWPYLDMFHRAIMDLKEEGDIDDLETKWWDAQGECWRQNHVEKALPKATTIFLNQTKPKVVTLNMFWGQLLFMAIGVVVTLIAAAGEIAYYRYKGKYKKGNQPRGESLNIDNEEGNL